MNQNEALAELVAGFDAFSTEPGGLSIEAATEAPAATTTFCAFTVSYMFTRATIQDGC